MTMIAAAAAAATAVAAALGKTWVVWYLMVFTFEPCCAQTTLSPDIQSVMDLVRQALGQTTTTNNMNNMNNPVWDPSGQPSIIETFGPITSSLLGGPLSPFPDPLNNPLTSQTGSQASPTSGQSQSTESNGLSGSGSQPLGDNILNKIASFISGSPNAGTGTSSMTSAAWDPYGLNGGPLLSQTPVQFLSSLTSSLETQAKQRLGQRMGKNLGVKEYYDIHGCVDPALMFTGRQRAMVSMGMAQSCGTVQASEVCNMVQARKQRSSSRLLAASVLSPQFQSLVEKCLTAKVLIRSLTPSLSPSLSLSPFSFSSSSSALGSSDPGVPSVRECGVLLSMVMDGGSVDAESMMRMRQKMLPWSCSETTLGPGGSYPYRVCCPGKVQEPTLQEAQTIRRMINT